MKKLLLSIFILAGAIVSNAQCNPNDYDFGDVQYAVYPDTVTGLLPGCLGQPYSQVVYFKVPTEAGDVNPAFAGAQISSIRLDSIVYDGAQNITNLGLNLSCSAPNCIFNGGAQYCGNITGTPNQVGDFQVSIVVTVFAFLNLGGFPVPVNFPFAFPGYTYSVSSCGTIGTQEYEYAFNLGSVSPNPANQTARIPFELPNTERVELSVVNMVGDQLIRKSFAGKRGENAVTLDVSDLPSGIYLYTMQSGSYKSTRKLVIQH